MCYGLRLRRLSFVPSIFFNGTLDLALHNASDSRFAGLANGLVNDLCQPYLNRDDGLDTMTLSPLCSFRLTTKSVWCRNAAAAGVVAALVQLDPRRNDLPHTSAYPTGSDFLTWCSNHDGATHTMSRLLELRQVPAWLQMTRQAIRSDPKSLDALCICGNVIPSIFPHRTFLTGRCNLC